MWAWGRIGGIWSSCAVRVDTYDQMRVLKVADQNLSVLFVTHAAAVLADTEEGATEVRSSELSAYAVEWDTAIPHPQYPFDAPNKRTALAQNLMAFDERQRYRIIRDLCDHQSVQIRNRDAARKLKLQLISRYGHLEGEALNAEVNEDLVDQTRPWLAEFPDALRLYDQALEKYQARLFARNLLDDPRLSLEKLLQTLLENDRSLENNIALLGAFVKQRGGSSELSNMFVKLVDYYGKYNNTYVKHDDAVIEEELEFVIEITSAFMKHLVRLAVRDVA